jgi:hypothetical protein
LWCPLPTWRSSSALTKLMQLMHQHFDTRWH